MTIGIVGIKRGMTRVFTEDGVSVPVTVIEATPNRITQVKSEDSDGYSAIQVTKGSIKPSRVNKPKAGHFSKANVEAGRKMWEFRTTGEEELSVGDALTVEAFEAGRQESSVNSIDKRSMSDVWCTGGRWTHFGHRRWSDQRYVE